MGQSGAGAADGSEVTEAVGLFRGFANPHWSLGARRRPRGPVGVAARRTALEAWP